MEMVYELLLKNLISETQKGNHIGRIYILNGEEGLGQQRFFDDYSAYITQSESASLILNVRSIPNTFSLYSIWNDLKKVRDLHFEFSDFSKTTIDNMGFNYEEYLLSQLIAIGRMKTLYFLCENINLCDPELKKFLTTIVRNIFPVIPCVLVCCNYQNNDPDLSKEISDIVELFSTFRNKTKYIQFKPWNDEQLVEYIDQYFNHHIIFENDSLVKAIVQSAFGNPTRLTTILEYLKSENIINENNMEYYCNLFDEKLLLIQTEKYVLKQYNKLDTQLQDLLRGSSVIGYEFDKLLLKKPLRLLVSDYQLKKIEYLTRLIHLEVDNIYKFNNDATYLSIKNIVSPAEYLEWNMTLGEYFFQEGLNKQNSNLFMEAVNDFIKSAFFYQAAEMYKETVHIYMRLIPMLISLMNYCLTIDIINDIHRLHSQRPGILSLEQHNRLYLFEAQCRHSLLQYPDAVAAYKKYLDFNMIPALQRLSVMCQYAMALYNSNEVMPPYQILLECLEKVKEIKDLEARSVEAKVLSFLSSVEETLGKPSHTDYFLKALDISKRYHIENVYYPLLRKALIVYKGEIGIRMMSEAKDYFKNSGNLKEYAMCLHNIAIEMLYHDDLEIAKNYLEESVKIFKNFGSVGFIYSLAAIGGYWCIKGRFKKALAYFDEVYKYEREDFTKIGLLINRATALRNLGHYSKGRKLLIEAEKLLSQRNSNEYAIIKQHCALNIALTEQAAKNHEYAYKVYLDYFSQEINQDSHRCVIAAQNLKELCTLSGKTFPHEYSKYLKRTSRTIDRLAPFSLVIVRFSFSD
jgi:hypothetical protein